MPARSPAASPTASRGGRFTLDGKTYQMPLNQNGKHRLHSGGKGFGKQPWTIVHHDEASVTLGTGLARWRCRLCRARSIVWCRYSLVGEATLRIELSATTDAATIVNLAHHSYFKLDDGADILDHELEIRANLIHAGRRRPDPGRFARSGRRHAVRFPQAAGDPLRQTRTARSSGTINDYRPAARPERAERRSPASSIAHAATLALAAQRACDAGLDDRAGARRSMTACKLDTPVPGLDGAALWRQRRHRARAAARAGLAEPAAFPLDRAAAGRGLSPGQRIPFQRVEVA